METRKRLKICERGHQFYKSSDCPVCPVCEKERIPQKHFLSVIAAPARRALEREGILTIEKLATYSEQEILALHGMGKSSIPKLKSELEQSGLSFRKK